MPKITTVNRIAVFIYSLLLEYRAADDYQQSEKAFCFLQSYIIPEDSRGSVGGIQQEGHDLKRKQSVTSSSNPLGRVSL